MIPAKKRVKKAIAVTLLESHPLVTRYILPILRRVPDILVSLNDEIFQVEHIETGLPHVFLVDSGSLPIRIKGYLHHLSSRLPNPKIVVLGGSLSENELCHLLFLGAAGFVKYDAIETQLIPSIRRVCEGHYAVRATVLERLAQHVSRLSQKRIDKQPVFSPREKLTLNLLQKGMSNKEIGFALGISQRTAKFHLANIFSKLGIHDRFRVAELTRSGDLLRKLEPQTQSRQESGNYEFQLQTETPSKQGAEKFLI